MASIHGLVLKGNRKKVLVLSLNLPSMNSFYVLNIRKTSEILNKTVKINIL